MLTIGLLFLRSRVRGVSSFRWRSLAFCFASGFLSGRVLLLLLPAYIIFASFLVYFDLRRQDLTNAMSACFLFLFFSYLLAYWDSTWVHLSHLEFGVEGLGYSLGLY